MAKRKKISIPTGNLPIYLQVTYSTKKGGELVTLSTRIHMILTKKCTSSPFLVGYRKDSAYIIYHVCRYNFLVQNSEIRLCVFELHAFHPTITPQMYFN